MRLGAALVAALCALCSLVGWASASAAKPDPSKPPATAATDVGSLPISAFYQDPDIGDARLSPSGHSLVMTKKISGVTTAVVYDLQGRTGTEILSDKDKDFSIDWIRWKGEDRLVMGITYLHYLRYDGEIYDFVYRSFLVSMDRDGSHSITLFQRQVTSAGRVFIAAFLDELRNDPDNILAISPTPATGSLAVWKTNIRTGAAQIVETGDSHTIGWNTDRDGAVVARLSVHGADFVLEGRAPGATTWSEVVRIRPKDIKALSDFEPLGPAEKPGQLYVAVKPQTPSEGKARTVRIYDFTTHSLGPPVWPALDYDIVDIVSPEGSNALDGVCYWVDTYRCDFKDPDFQANFRAMERFLDGKESLNPVSVSDDNRWWVFMASGPSDPGSYYLYDWQKKTMENLGQLFPGLPPEKLGTMDRITIKARDGMPIPAYLTHPPGAASGPLPLVVLPHGGPEARDDFDYDTWSQVLATRGYLVLQPNFRGSGGYGVAYAEAGYGQWGAKMQDDITDGVNQLIASGQADPKRICIFGASYGGYAALIGGAQSPDLYKCVVSWAGVSDLEKLMRTEKGGLFVGERSPAYDYDLKAIGDPETDKDRLARTSAVTYAPHYGPPVLLIHGADDTIVPPDQSREMESALKSAGRDVKLTMVKDEDHSGWTHEHEQAAIAEVVGFIEAHIAPATLTPAEPPAATAPATPPAASTKP